MTDQRGGVGRWAVSEQERELDALDEGADLRELLLQRVERAQAETRQALEGLRAAMSDDEALDEYGIDTSQA